MHYAIVIIIIATIVMLQWRTFRSTEKKLNDFKAIFAAENSAYTLNREEVIYTIKTVGNETLKRMISNAGLQPASFQRIERSSEGVEEIVFDRAKAVAYLVNQATLHVSGITAQHNSATLTAIVDSINSYLANNKGAVSDFNLIKDIVDRSCDAQEEEIHTQIPVPLYLGLVGTMGGILVGVLYLWLSGGLAELLNSSVSANGAAGVEALLGGVGIAMASSIFGIVLATTGSSKVANGKRLFEKNKNIFLSWIQAKLLPSLSNSVVDTLEKMSRNLANFNETFAANTRELSGALAQVNVAYNLQTRLMSELKQLKIEEIAAANVTVYNNLKGCTNEIGYFGAYLHSVNEYIAHVKALNDKLDRHETRTKAIEEMGVFFKSEVEQIEQRKDAISKAVGKVDDYLQQALEKLRENADAQLVMLQKSAAHQQDMLQRKMEETGKMVEELKNLTEVKKGIAGFERATADQNRKIDLLTAAIEKLAQVKASGGTIRQKLPRWAKIMLIVAGSLASVVCLREIVLMVVVWSRA